MIIRARLMYLYVYIGEINNNNNNNNIYTQQHIEIITQQVME